MKPKTKRAELLEIYNAQAERLAVQYDRVTTEGIFPHLSRWLPEHRTGTAFDIACGSGQNAYWLTQQGFQVIAVDGAHTMLREATKRFHHPKLEFYLDLAPELRHCRRISPRADFILCASMWMHLSPQQQGKMLYSLRAIAKPDCTVLINLRYGPTPADRPMYAVNPHLLKGMSEARGWRFYALPVQPDALGRPNISWQDCYLQRGTHRPPPGFDSSPI